MYVAVDRPEHIVMMFHIFSSWMTKHTMQVIFALCCCTSQTEYVTFQMNWKNYCYAEIAHRQNIFDLLA